VPYHLQRLIHQKDMKIHTKRGNPTVKKGHAKTFSSELIHTYILLKIQKVSNILGNSE
jgi:hypothetical protein